MEDFHPNLTLAELGEHAVIQEIMRHAPSKLNGDDAAVLNHTAPNARCVVTTDTLVHNRHFRLDWSTPAEIGNKVVTQNFADIEAMGARPTAGLLALSIPHTTPISFVSELSKGIHQRLKAYGGELVGGDITDSDTLVISFTAIGQLGGNLPPLYLNQVRPGQHLIASGDIGASAAGLALLQRMPRADIPAIFEPLIQAHCATTVPPGRGFVARAAGVTAMTDNSDGLIADIHTLARRSRVAIDLFPHALEPSPLIAQAAAYLGDDPWQYVLTGGEDHTLLASTYQPAPTGFRVIGTVSKSHCEPAVTVGGKTPAYTHGWTSF